MTTVGVKLNSLTDLAGQYTLGAANLSRPQLVSLLEMLRNYLPFYKIAGDLHRQLGIATLLREGSSKLPDQEAKSYERLLGEIQEACENLGLPNTAEMARRAAQRKVKTYDDIYHGLTHLNDLLTNDLGREAIFSIPPERTGYYEHDDLFGPAVAAAFPSCARDVRKAGSCYALEQEDGCVHHLMMVLERGLITLAVKVGVPSHRTNWQQIINEIEKKLQTMPRGKDRDFYTEVNSQFGFLKNAYRNHSEHTRDDPYDMEKAQSIFNHVRHFMEELAKGGLAE